MRFSIPLSSPKYRVFFLIIEFYILVKLLTNMAVYEIIFKTVVDFNIPIDNLDLLAIYWCEILGSYPFHHTTVWRGRPQSQSHLPQLGHYGLPCQL